MKPAKVFVPGKVHLSGEHAVVYGFPALLSTLNLGITVEIVPSDELVVQSTHRDGRGLITQALKTTGITGKVRVTITSTLPVGSGLGSSAALAAAVIKAATLAQGKSLTQTEWFEKTMECERIAHGNPSGGDPATVTSRGLVRFVKGIPPEQITAAKKVELFLVQTGKPKEGTLEMVEMVAQRKRQQPAKIAKIFAHIGETTEAILGNLKEGRDILELINTNGRLLEELGVVSERVREFSAQLRLQGVAVKISGAGGIRKGSGILLAMGHENEIIEACERFGLPYWKVVLG